MAKLMTHRVSDSAIAFPWLFSDSLLKLPLRLAIWTHLKMNIRSIPSIQLGTPPPTTTKQDKEKEKKKQLDKG